MKLRHIMFAILTAVVVGLTTSCSKRGEILDTIPADVTMVATVNADKLCSAMGVTLKADGTAEIAAPVQGVIGSQAKVLDELAALKAEGVVDIENIVVAIDGDNVTYVTTLVSDMDKVVEKTQDYVGWNEGSNGYKIGRGGSATLLAKNGQIWAVSGARDAIKAVEGMVKGAKEMSVGSLDGVAEALARDNMANVAVAAGFATLTTSGKSNTEIAVQDKEWNIASLQEGADNSLVLDWEMMQSTGRTVKPKGMQNINPALLAYVPGNFNVAFAAGLTGEFDWEPLRKLVMLAGGFQTAAFMSVVNPYLESIDGTVLMAAAPSSPELLTGGDASDWDFIVMAHMPQDKINSLTAMIRNMMSTAGMTPSVTENGLLAVPQYGKTMYIGNVDGYLGISTVGFDNTRNNPLAPTFVNKDMAASLTLEPLSAYMPVATGDAGLVLTASMDNGKGSFKVKATGTQSPLLVFLMSALR